MFPPLLLNPIGTITLQTYRQQLRPKLSYRLCDLPFSLCGRALVPTDILRKQALRNTQTASNSRSVEFGMVHKEAI